MQKPLAGIIGCSKRPYACWKSPQNTNLKNNLAYSLQQFYWPVFCADSTMDDVPKPLHLAGTAVCSVKLSSAKTDVETNFAQMISLPPLLLVESHVTLAEQNQQNHGIHQPQTSNPAEKFAPSRHDLATQLSFRTQGRGISVDELSSQISECHMWGKAKHGCSNKHGIIDGTAVCSPEMVEIC